MSRSTYFSSLGLLQRMPENKTTDNGEIPSTALDSWSGQDFDVPRGTDGNSSNNLNIEQKPRTSSLKSISESSSDSDKLYIKQDGDDSCLSDFDILTPPSSPESFESGIEWLPSSPSDSDGTQADLSSRTDSPAPVQPVPPGSPDSPSYYDLAPEELHNYMLSQNEHNYEEMSDLGFCTMCEVGCATLRKHLTMDHRLNFKLYTLAYYNKTVILKPKATINDELGQCEACFGVFFKHRLQNHCCERKMEEPNWFGENFGPEYCLMCQFRCEDVENHLIWAHYDVKNSQRYEIATVKGIRTLAPKGCNLRGDDIRHNLRCCHYCQPFTYNNRRRRVCERQKRMLDLGHTYELMTHDAHLDLAADQFHSF